MVDAVDTSYRVAMNWFRTKICFAQIRALILCMCSRFSYSVVSTHIALKMMSTPVHMRDFYVLICYICKIWYTNWISKGLFKRIQHCWTNIIQQCYYNRYDCFSFKYFWLDTLFWFAILVNEYKLYIRFNSKKFERCKIWATFIYVGPPLLWAELVRRTEWTSFLNYLNAKIKTN
jgi:hypothetical protein